MLSYPSTLPGSAPKRNSCSGLHYKRWDSFFTAELKFNHSIKKYRFVKLEKWKHGTIHAEDRLEKSSNHLLSTQGGRKFVRLPPKEFNKLLFQVSSTPNSKASGQALVPVFSTRTKALYKQFRQHLCLWISQSETVNATHVKTYKIILL